VYDIYYESLVISLYNEIIDVYYICTSMGTYIILCIISSCNDNNNNNGRSNGIIEVSGAFVVFRSTTNFITFIFNGV
jgi:hypothetical protein